MNDDEQRFRNLILFKVWMTDAEMMGILPWVGVGTVVICLIILLL